MHFHGDSARYGTDKTDSPREIEDTSIVSTYQKNRYEAELNIRSTLGCHTSGRHPPCRLLQPFLYR